MVQGVTKSILLASTLYVLHLFQGKGFTKSAQTLYFPWQNARLLSMWRALATFPPPFLYLCFNLFYTEVTSTVPSSGIKVINHLLFPLGPHFSTLPVVVLCTVMGSRGWVMMGKRKVLFLPSLSGCTAFCSVPRYSCYSSHRAQEIQIC